MSQEKLKEILIALQDNENKAPNAKRQIFLYAFAEINRIVMECVPKKADAETSSFSNRNLMFSDGVNQAIAVFKANWEGK